MSDLIKRAVADAKAVRTIAIENAKIALEESFKRGVQGMFSDKIKEDLAQEEQNESSVEEQVSSGIGSGTPLKASNKPKKQPNTKVEKQKFDATLDEEAQTESEEVVNEESSDSITNEELEEILSSMEKELAEEEEQNQDPNAAPQVPPVPQVPPAPVDPNAAPVPPVPPVPPAPIDPNAAPVVPPVPQVPPAPVDPNAAPSVPPADPNAPQSAPVAEEEVDLQEILDSIMEEDGVVAEASDKDDDDDEDDDKEDKKDVNEEVKKLRSKLNEALSVIKELREVINEVNVLNSKLLYTNKLFKEFALNKEQKTKIVENFDTTNSVREVKIAYKILADQLSSGLGSSVVKNKTNTTVSSITEGLSSKTVASTKPSKDVIVEQADEMVLKFQRLAGIKK